MRSVWTCVDSVWTLGGLCVDSGILGGICVYSWWNLGVLRVDSGWTRGVPRAESVRILGGVRGGVLDGHPVSGVRVSCPETQDSLGLGIGSTRTFPSYKFFSS